MLQLINVALNLALVLTTWFASSDCEVRSLGSIAIPLPGLLNRFEHQGATGVNRFSILASSYSTSMNSYDKAYMLVRPGHALPDNFTDYRPKIIYNALRWPKEIKQIPYSVFDHDAVTIPDGCKINGKMDGNVYETDVTDPDFPRTTALTDNGLPTKSNYNYVDTVWRFNPRLGKDDMITCRVKFSGDLLVSAQLVFFNHPTFGDESRKWGEKVLKEAACDSNLAGHTHRYRRDDWSVIYTTGVYTKRLDIFWPETKRGNPGGWDDADDIRSLILSEGREFFDVQTVDVNWDGRTDLLVTVQSSSNGSVEVWEIPDDFRDTSQYVRHVIASGFNSRSGDKGRTPGSVRPFYPRSGQTGKPWILVSGVDDGRAYYLQPLTDLTHDWSYEIITVADEGANQSIGGVEVADVDGDGYSEIFVSVHNKNKINVYSFLENKF